MNLLKVVRLVAALLSVVLVVLPIPAIAASPRVPRIEIKPKRAFTDEKVKIILRGFPAEQLVTVRVRASDDLAQTWESHAEFLTDAHGFVDVSKQRPVSGTYQQADASGLFWSMALPADDKNPWVFARESLKPADFEFTADVNGQTVVVTNFQRYYIAPGVERIPVHDGKIRGIFFVPTGKGPHPAVIVLSGSDGGVHEMYSAFLASKGYSVLALAYFNYDDLPKSLVNYPLENFEAAINWLKLRREVRGDEIAVIGESKGAELALLAGSTFRQIKAVIAISGNGVVFPGVPDAGGDPAQPAWTYQGRPVPFMSGKDLTPDQLKRIQELSWTPPVSTLPAVRILLENRTAVEKASMPVENINGPVLLISGKLDPISPSAMLAEMLMERLKQAKHPFPDRHLNYENNGHVFLLPNFPTTVSHVVHPVTKMDVALGGDAKNGAAAGADAWARIVEFLHTTFTR